MDKRGTKLKAQKRQNIDILIVIVATYLLHRKIVFTNYYLQAWKQLFSSPATTMRKLFQPKMEQVHDVTFDDIFAEACIILMQHAKKDLQGEELEATLERTVERAALRNQLDECRLIGSRTLAFSAMKECSAEAPADFAPMHSCGEHADFAPAPKLKPSAETQLLAAIKENSPAVWRLLYEQLFNSFQQEFYLK